MSTLQCGTNEQKIELFFRLYDTDGNGNLSYQEIQHLCRLQLAGNIGAVDSFTEDVSEYFTRMIFDAVNVKHHIEITLEQMKVAIFECNNTELFELFCAT